MIDWVWPWIFMLLPLPFAVRKLLPPLIRREPALRVPELAYYRMPGGIMAAPTYQHSSWRLVLLCFAWIGLVTAAAQPLWTGEPVSLPASGRNMMLAVDISGSMGTEDMLFENRRVDRLTVVKSVVSDFIETRQGDRIGLILFGTNAYLQAPLTFDLESVNQLLKEAPVGIAGGQTAIGDAIGLSVKHLQNRPEDQRVLILLTDGASNTGEVAPLKAAQLARARKLKIYTIGVGAEQMRLPGLFGSRMVNPSAELDEGTLQSIADQTGGRYFRAKNTEKLIEIYQLIDAMEPVEQEAEVYRPIAALFYWPLALSCIAFAITLLPAAFRRRHA